MRQIKLIHITNPEKNSIYTNRRLYSVSLGNGSVHYFKNKKIASSFLVSVSEFLTLKAFELNMCISDLQSRHRQLFFIYDSFPFIEREIESLLSDSSLSILMACERSAFPNGNFFSFSHLNNSADHLISITEKQRYIYKQRNMHSEVYTSKIIQSRIDSIKTEIYTLDIKGETEDLFYQEKIA